MAAAQKINTIANSIPSLFINYIFQAKVVLRDSYIAWNFFDAVLGQKEGYRPYAFEDIAAEYLQNHPEV